MGKKSGSHGGEKTKEEKASAFVLKVAMHCNCDGCNDKIRAAVKGITLLQGIETWDQSALETKGELRLVATADPEKLRHRLHKATRKNVDLIFPKENKQDASKAGKDVAAAQALLLNSLQQQQGHQHGWANQLLAGAGGGWNAHGGGYGAAAAYHPSWGAVQQPDPYTAYSGAYPAPGGGGWSAYPPPAQGYGGAYGWHGHGY